MTDKDNFSYSLAQVHKQINESISALTEFEKTFSTRHENSINKGKDGLFLSNHEFLCTAKLYQSIQANLFSSFQVLIDSAKHEKLQNQLSEEMVKGLIMNEITREKNRAA